MKKERKKSFREKMCETGTGEERKKNRRTKQKKKIGRKVMRDEKLLVKRR